MGKNNLGYVRMGGYRGICIRCKAPFIGKGDRCQQCADDLRKRRKRKPR